ncbi:MAG: pyridoxamine 5'-phosphate oxidase family protein, partial [Gammaproteobacteria bacterium]|nr:pyridoxamine 5'-phosphate oxidase family protein [Gammaproteobacteria bacterium]
RRATPQELAATVVVRIPINEASAKIRSGPPIDDQGDLEADVWAGVIPLAPRVLEPVAAPDLADTVVLPDYIRDYGPVR